MDYVCLFVCLFVFLFVCFRWFPFWKTALTHWLRSWESLQSQGEVWMYAGNRQLLNTYNLFCKCTCLADNNFECQTWQQGHCACHFWVKWGSRGLLFHYPSSFIVGWAFNKLLLVNVWFSYDLSKEWYNLLECMMTFFVADCQGGGRACMNWQNLNLMC